MSYVETKYRDIQKDYSEILLRVTKKSLSRRSYSYKFVLLKETVVLLQWESETWKFAVTKD